MTLKIKLSSTRAAHGYTEGHFIPKLVLSLAIIFSFKKIILFWKSLLRLFACVKCLSVVIPTSLTSTFAWNYELQQFHVYHHPSTASRQLQAAWLAQDELIIWLVIYMPIYTWTEISHILTWHNHNVWSTVKNIANTYHCNHTFFISNRLQEILFPEN